MVYETIISQASKDVPGIWLSVIKRTLKLRSVYISVRFLAVRSGLGLLRQDHCLALEISIGQSVVGVRWGLVYLGGW